MDHKAEKSNEQFMRPDTAMSTTMIFDDNEQLSVEPNIPQRAQRRVAGQDEISLSAQTDHRPLDRSNYLFVLRYLFPGVYYNAVKSANDSAHLQRTSTQCFQQSVNKMFITILLPRLTPTGKRDVRQHKTGFRPDTGYIDQISLPLSSHLK